MILATIKICLIWIVALPLSIIALLSTPLDRTGRTFHWTSRMWSSYILWLFHVRVRTTGEDSIDPSKHYIYISNHASASIFRRLLWGSRTISGLC